VIALPPVDRAHCTRWRAVHRIASRFPDAFAISTVGKTIEL
jgi:metal-dependent hydrolase (beta-lactamase superfamily II)